MLIYFMALLLNALIERDLLEAGKIVKYFFDPLSEIQQTVLKLLGVTTGPFGS